MTPSEFVDVLRHEAAGTDSVRQTLKNPSGRKPDAALVALSEYYKSLGPAERDFVDKVIELSAHQTLFGVLCILDGVRPVEGFGPKGKFELYFTKDRESTRLNDPDREMLHDIFNAS